MDGMPVQRIRFNALSGLSCYDMVRKLNAAISKVSMPSRAYTSFLLIIELGYITYITLVSMPSRAYTSFLPNHVSSRWSSAQLGFNALSGLYLISTRLQSKSMERRWIMFQCPLGLIPHFYTHVCAQQWRQHSRFQCPLGLIPHFYGTPSKT